ncbi:MAG TPA: TonB-dependent receptor plug domain-containing protein, partial [Chitinophagaceae bacterium]|nr:TonB-dependent receptor plug domain-containing protein [Chitinophagaceae bacterium]
MQIILRLFFAILIVSNVNAQQRVISGKVTDDKGLPLVGATILEKKSNKGTESREGGIFTLSIPDSNARLIISFIGYSTTDVAVNNQTYIAITLLASVSNLDSMVVIGYGTSKKKDLTGAVSSVKEKDFNKGTFTSPDLLIQGKVSGVQITYNNGQPGGAANIKIRGNSALSGTGQPLFVIDGVPLDGRSLQAGNNPLNFINPADVASIDILKDASATAIYGSRAAYGVMIINTKKGQAGPPRLDVAVSVGVSSILKKIDVLNASEFRDAIKYYGVSPSFDRGGDEDAMDAILQNGIVQNYSLAGSGGNDNGKYRYSLGLLDQDGIII